MKVPDNNHIALKIKIEGLVQGVGFRPLIYNLAILHNIKGYVMNLNDGVEIYAEAQKSAVHVFLSSIESQKPNAAEIHHITTSEVPLTGLTEFEIKKSMDINDFITEISPDIAVCEECLNDLISQPYRLNYPLINCTHCGPRFSIVKELPYDRINTTMGVFEMCNSCKKEYEDIMDRRFHAQPVACNNCGPKYQLLFNGRVIENINEVLLTVVKLTENGKIFALKGIGGFHLMCNALDEEAVNRLRRSKHREGKPFAVLFRDLKTIKKYAHVSEVEEESLLSWKRPIVILKMKQALATSVTSGFNTIGGYLPYMPFHHLFFQRSSLEAIVLTSGNFSEEPIIIENKTAEKKLTNIADAVITYNRDIYNRTDDSVVRVISGKERVFRRSRGYAPSPVKVSLNLDGILAIGAELNNCFCIGKGNQAILSQHIGDLKNHETYSYFTQTIEKYKKLFRCKPAIVACDMHPDYLSTKFATELGLQKIEVQHHHAHIASCMAEHNLNEKVIGVSFDGTGFGTDRNIWGSEFFIADLEGFERVSHFDYIGLPGGDLVAEEPWRTAISYLHTIYGNNLDFLNIPFVHELDKKKLELVIQALDKNINCPLSSGAGRLFDAVAALIKVCPVTLFHAEAPMRLESIITDGVQDRYEVSFNSVISFNEMFRQIIDDITNSIDKGVISAKFHNTVIYAIFRMVLQMGKERGLKKVVLSGGTFQNKYIVERLKPLLRKRNFEVYTQSKVPCNDGGIALGQLVIASKLRI